MSECEECKQKDQESDGCTYGYVAFPDKPEKLFPRDRTHFDEESGRCHDCGAMHGNIHHFGCDVEKCPKCGANLPLIVVIRKDPSFGFFLLKMRTWYSR
jgi:hypothetical protein